MNDSIPDTLLEPMAEKFRMLGDPTRLRILRVLLAGERNVSEVVEETGQNQANVSKHLKTLAESGLVARRKEGLQAFYRVEDPLVEELCRLVCRRILEETEAEIRQHQELLRAVHPARHAD